MIILKKCAALLLLVLLLLGVTTGCSNRSEITPAGVTKDIMTYVDADIKWVSLKEEELNGYFGFSGEDLTAHSAYINDAEEKYDIVAAFEFKNTEALHSAVEKVSASLVAATQNFASVIDTEKEKIVNRLILSKDNILVVVVASNNINIKDMLTEKGFSVVA